MSSEDLPPIYKVDDKGNITTNSKDLPIANTNQTANVLANAQVADKQDKSFAAVSTPQATVTTQVPIAAIPAKYYLKSRMLSFNGFLMIIFTVQFFLQQFTDLKVVSLLFPNPHSATVIANYLSALLLVIGNLISAINFFLRVDTSQPVTFNKS